MTTDEKYTDIRVEDDPIEDEASISYDIATYPSDFTLLGLYDKYKNGDIFIPDFQREFVWSIKQSSLLIESFMLGLPVPPVFLYVDAENKYQVIDGQQRILSFCFFFEGYFGSENLRGRRKVFRLEGLNEYNKYYRLKFDNFSPSDQRKLQNTVLRAINVRQLSPTGEASSIYHIFERLNTGGSPLKPQEIRNCVYRGNLVPMLRELNKEANWRKIVGKIALDRHQKDVELILRIMALSYGADEYEKPMKEFLNTWMSNHRSGKTKQAKEFVKNFPKLTELIVNKLGEKPFHLRGPLNSSALDAVCSTLYHVVDDPPGKINKNYNAMLNDEAFISLTRLATTDTNVVLERIKMAQERLIKE